MKNDEKKVNELPSPATGASDQGLHQLMDELGMETKSKEDRARYHREARARHLAPRVFAGTLIALTALLALLLVTAPPELRDWTATEGPSQWRLEMKTNRFMLMGGVTARLDGRPIDVSKGSHGRYSVTTDRNGQLTVTVKSMAGRETSQTFSVTSIDKIPPHIVDSALKDEYHVGDELCLYLEDEGGAGVDWESVSVTDLESGEPCADVKLDPEEGTVRFPLPDASVHIAAADSNGNQLAMVLKVT